MSTDNPNLYGAMTDAVAASEDELALYGFTLGVAFGGFALDQEFIWIEKDGEAVKEFENVPEFEAWASKTIDAHREATA